MLADRLIACWRGAVAARFPDDPRFHGHDSDTAFRHRHPEIHYRWIDGAPALLALRDAAAAVLPHPWTGSELRLGDEIRTVVSVDWRSRRASLALSGELIRYRFGAPWIALNQDNHARWKSASPDTRRALLDRAVRNHLLGALDDLGWFLPEGWRLYAAFELRELFDVPFKQQKLLGFEGDFVCNLELPDDLAIGKAVSHGHGWFRRVAAEI